MDTGFWTELLGVPSLRLRCLFSGHLWCYAFNGPPIAGLGGPWHVCVRCGLLDEFAARGGRRLVSRDDHTPQPV